jgi:hypothetical protein
MSLTKLLKAFESHENFVAGEIENNGNASIQRLTSKYGSLKKHKGTWI